jgi:hypothetical protein
MFKVTRLATALAIPLSCVAMSCAGPVPTGTPVLASAGTPAAVATVIPGSAGFYVFVLALIGVLLFSSLMLIRKPASMSY